MRSSLINKAMKVEYVSVECIRLLLRRYHYVHYVLYIMAVNLGDRSALCECRVLHSLELFPN